MPQGNVRDVLVAAPAKPAPAKLDNSVGNDKSRFLRVDDTYLVPSICRLESSILCFTSDIQEHTKTRILSTVVALSVFKGSDT